MKTALRFLGIIRALPCCLAFAVILLIACGGSSEFKSTKEKAIAGNPQAQLDLSMMYLLGKGTKVNGEEGAKWCREAADKGDPTAHTNYSRRSRASHCRANIIVKTGRECGFSARA